MVIGSTLFQYKDIHEMTWRSPDDFTYDQIDLILIESRHVSNLLDVRTLEETMQTWMIFLVICKIRAKIAMKFTRNATGEYKLARRDEKRQHKSKKICHKENLLEEVEKLKSSNESRAFYRAVNKERKDFKPRTTLCKDKNGVIISEKEKTTPSFRLSTLELGFTGLWHTQLFHSRLLHLSVSVLWSSASLVCGIRSYFTVDYSIFPSQYFGARLHWFVAYAVISTVDYSIFPSQYFELGFTGLWHTQLFHSRLLHLSVSVLWSSASLVCGIRSYFTVDYSIFPSQYFGARLHCTLELGFTGLWHTQLFHSRLLHLSVQYFGARLHWFVAYAVISIDYSIFASQHFGALLHIYICGWRCSSLLKLEYSTEIIPMPSSMKSAEECIEKWSLKDALYPARIRTVAGNGCEDHLQHPTSMILTISLTSLLERE
ncbi:hypothetical protein CEXT_295521 [Caerostris extrusa]|uniref:Uncharacterized protein n=1 Tax=Caerostris extrusa TaxID=172846 RepID=A0AAV4PLI1_CAEEX|nr:hypothetical protein CEXT_295521 [Caerostris extrusa]